GFHYVDFADLDAVEETITEKTKAIFLETPTNPLMQETDIAAVSELAKRHGLLLIVDNTFYTPVLQRPIEQGADIVIHSATKYLGGHNDVLAGLVVAKGEELCQRLAEYHNAIGAVLSPFDSWLLIRGMKTLALRMRQHEENAKRISAFLREHEDVTDVLYPGRGGMLSFRIDDEKWVNGFLKSLRLITFAESLGGVESFITYPATQTHADIPEEIRIRNGVCNRLLRFSVGIEHADDLIADLAQAFKNMKEV
ncbi:cystathionine gamma-synthase, partial [Geobacillus sp. T6]